ncbi:MAG: hypothetical protein ACHQ50_12765 [Fimbriimonadales bacterium]
MKRLCPGVLPPDHQQPRPIAARRASQRLGSAWRAPVAQEHPRDLSVGAESFPFTIK